MCQISSHLKLCTCSKNKIFSSNSYWILYRWKKSDEVIVGEPIFPDNNFIDPADELSNQEKLITILNQDNCFDFELQLEDKDSLEINILCLRENGRSINLIYAFVFLDGIWKSMAYDPFDMERQEKKYGVIEM